MNTVHTLTEDQRSALVDAALAYAEVLLEGIEVPDGTSPAARSARTSGHSQLDYIQNMLAGADVLGGPVGAHWQEEIDRTREALGPRPLPGEVTTEATVFIDGLSVDVVTGFNAEGEPYISLVGHEGVALHGEQPGQYFVIDEREVQA